MVEELDEDEIKDKKELEEGLKRLRLQKESDIRKLTARQFAQKLIEEKVIEKVEERELDFPEFKKEFREGRLVSEERGERIPAEEGFFFSSGLFLLPGSKRPVLFKKPFIQIEQEFPRKERDVTLAHELLHALHPTWNEDRVEKEQSSFFRRDPFDDIVGFRPPSRAQPFLQLGERPFISVQTKKKGLISKFRFPKTLTNKGFRVQPRQKTPQRGMFTMFIKQKVRTMPKRNNRMRFL